MKRDSVILILVLLLAFLNNAKANPIQSINVYFDGIPRNTLFYRPQNINPDKKIPLVLVLHRNNMSNDEMSIVSDCFKNCNELGFAAVFPAGNDKLWDLQTDEGFIITLIDTLAEKYNIDVKQVFVYGYGEGGDLAYKILTRRPDLFKAAGLVSFSIEENPVLPSKPIPVAVINNEEDELFKTRQKHSNTLDFFKNAFNITSNPITVFNRNTAKCNSFPSKNDDFEIISCECKNSGNLLPGGNYSNNQDINRSNRELNATNFLFSFFLKYADDKTFVEPTVSKQELPSTTRTEEVNKFGFLTQDRPPAQQRSARQNLTVWDKMFAGIMSSFSFKDEFPRNKYTAADYIFDGFSGNFTAYIPIHKTDPVNEKGSKTQGEPSNNFSLAASVKYNPISNWFFRVTFFKYLKPDLQAPWHPDFTYNFGYDDWRPYTLSFVYNNYTGNRLFPDKSKGEIFSNFLQGSFSLGWKLPAPDFIENLLKIHSTSSLGHIINYNVTPEYFDLKTGKENWKQSISFNTKYNIYSYFYINVNLFYYFKPNSQQPWDPDFTYGFGYFDWHTGTITIQYNNYSGNRFFWREKSSSTGAFQDGSLSVSWSWAY